MQARATTPVLCRHQPAEYGGSDGQGFYFLEVGYMSEETEEQAFALAFRHSEGVERKMVPFAVQIRGSFERGDLRLSEHFRMSTRTLA